MITININDVEMKLEEARELYKLLGELFGQKPESLPPNYSIRDPLGQRPNYVGNKNIDYLEDKQ